MYAVAFGLLTDCCMLRRSHAGWIAEQANLRGTTAGGDSSDSSSSSSDEEDEVLVDTPLFGGVAS